MERLRGMYEHSELVLFLQGPNQTAALRWQSGFLDLNMTLNLPTQHCPPLDVSATPPSIRAREARLRRRVSEEV